MVRVHQGPPFLAGVAKLVDALDLGSSALRHGGSSPFARTNIKESSRFELLYKDVERLMVLYFLYEKCEGKI